MVLVLVVLGGLALGGVLWLALFAALDREDRERAARPDAAPTGLTVDPAASRLLAGALHR